MNAFALNAAAINDSNEVWSWYGASDVAMQSVGEGIRGATLSGASQVVMQSDAVAFAYLMPPASSSSVALSSTAQALYGRAGEGVSQIQIASTGDGTRRVMGESSVEIVFEADGDAQVVPPISGTSNIVLEMELEERVTPALIGEGVSAIVLNTELLSHRGKSVRLEPFEARIEVASIAAPYIIIKSPAAASLIALEGLGEARLGGRIYLDPLEALIEVASRGDSSRLRYIYGEGQSAIELLAGSLLAGIPPIPTVYVPAPRSRTFIVQRDARDMRVARENRSL